MQVLVLLSTLGFIFAGTLVGARLLLLARRTRGVPELAMGGALFLLAGVAYPLSLLGVLGEGLPDSLRIFLVFAASTVACLSPIGLLAFNWKVFRPDQSWARVLGAVLALGCVGVALTTGWSLVGKTDFVTARAGIQDLQILRTLVTAGVFLWTFAEALHYHGSLRRRLEIGLVEPVVLNRVALWAGASGASLMTNGTSLVTALLGLPVIGTPMTALPIAIGGSAAAVCLYLAFAPPARYLAWVGGEAEPSAA